MIILIELASSLSPLKEPGDEASVHDGMSVWYHDSFSPLVFFFSTADGMLVWYKRLLYITNIVYPLTLKQVIVFKLHNKRDITRDFV